MSREKVAAAGPRASDESEVLISWNNSREVGMRRSSWARLWEMLGGEMVNHTRLQRMGFNPGGT